MSRDPPLHTHFSENYIIDVQCDRNIIFICNKNGGMMSLEKRFYYIDEMLGLFLFYIYN